MKEPRFIELLNLYVDQEISQGDACELESEIRSNPTRRAVYQQYCRLHRACSVLHEHHEGNATQRDSEDTVVDFPASTGLRWLPVLSGLGMAACLALFVIRSNRLPEQASINTPVVTSVQLNHSDLSRNEPAGKLPINSSAVESVVVMPSAVSAGARNRYTLSSLHYTSNPDTNAVVSFSPAALDWLGPLPKEGQPDSFAIDAKSKAKSISGMKSSSASATAEMTAFQFTK